MSEVFIDAQNNYDDGPRHTRRSRSEVLPDYRFHQLLDGEIDIDINKALEENRLQEELPDDRIYFVNKIFYHTGQNVSLEQGNIYKVNEGPNGEGRAGDIDTGFLDLSSGRIRRIELKSPGRIPERAVRSSEERSYDTINHGEKQNRYFRKLLDTFEDNTGWDIPYSPRVEAWNDVVDGEIQDINSIPKYSQNGAYVASDEAIERAKNSEKIEALNHAFFKGWMLGGGENIIREMELG
mgnify:CR=1 FL=1